MSFKKAIQQISVPAPAKVNLYLAVLGKRKDDYHDIVSVLAKLNLYDIVTVEQYGEENFLRCDCVSSSSLKGDIVFHGKHEDHKTCGNCGLSCEQTLLHTHMD